MPGLVFDGSTLSAGGGICPGTTISAELFFVGLSHRSSVSYEGFRSAKYRHIGIFRVQGLSEMSSVQIFGPFPGSSSNDRCAHRSLSHSRVIRPIPRDTRNPSIFCSPPTPRVHEEERLRWHGLAGSRHFWNVFGPSLWSLPRQELE